LTIAGACVLWLAGIDLFIFLFNLLGLCAWLLGLRRWLGGLLCHWVGVLLLRELLVGDFCDFAVLTGLCDVNDLLFIICSLSFLYLIFFVVLYLSRNGRGRHASHEPKGGHSRLSRWRLLALLCFLLFVLYLLWFCRLFFV